MAAPGEPARDGGLGRGGAGVADLSTWRCSTGCRGAEGWLGWWCASCCRGAGGTRGRGGGCGWSTAPGIGIAGPGGKAAFRLHAAFDLAARRFDALELTGGTEAASLARRTAGPGEVLVADRFYAKATGVHQVVAQGGHVVTRRGLTACRLLAADGQKLDAIGPWPIPGGMSAQLTGRSWRWPEPIPPSICRCWCPHPGVLVLRRSRPG